MVKAMERKRKGRRPQPNQRDNSKSSRSNVPSNRRGTLGYHQQYHQYQDHSTSSLRWMTIEQLDLSKGKQELLTASMREWSSRSKQQNNDPSNKRSSLMYHQQQDWSNKDTSNKWSDHQHWDWDYNTSSYRQLLTGKLGWIQ